MSGKLKLFTFTLAMIFFIYLPEANSTHIVGGDMTYRCLGKNQYEITLTFTRDCEYGADDAPFDDYALVAIYDQYYNPVGLGGNGLLPIPYVKDDTLNTSLENDCEILGYEVCVHQSIYRDTIHLLPKSGGYILSYQRCCRNSTLLNVKDPLETGSTHTIHITEAALESCNSSPVFNNWPEIYICTNKSIDFDHSATDLDGDSLVYKLFTPYQGASVANPQPDRFSEFDVPYTLLEWADGYGLNNLLGGDPLQIDPETGFITGVPNQEGQFLVGIMVEEYRDGQLLSTVKRDFEYNVRVCMEPPVADFIAPDVLCGADEFEVSFINTSQYADSYFWQFEYPETSADKTSIDENPIYTYPNNPAYDGKDTFTVSLKAIRSLDQCFDQIFKDILVIEDALITDFDHEILGCPDDSLDIHLFDLSHSLNPSYTVNAWSWTITLNDGTIITREGKDAYITIPKQGDIQVVLEIETEEGCFGKIEKTVELIFASIEFVGDPVAMCVGDTTLLVANPNSAWTYTWEPEEGLLFEDINDKSNPECIILHDTTYYVTVTDGICTVEDSVDVLVQDYLEIFIEGPEFVCDDYITLIARGGQEGITEFEWAENDSFDPIIAEGDTVTFFINGWMKEYFLRVKEGTGCSNTIDSFEAYNNSIDMDYDKNVSYCYGMEKDIVLSNNRPDDILEFSWTASPYIISDLDNNFVTIYSDAPGSFDLIFFVTNQFGCELTDTITITSNEGPSLSLDAQLECDSYKYCFTAFGGAGTDYEWTFGDPETEADVSNEVSPCYEYPYTGSFTVSVSAYFEECGDTLTLTQEIMVPEPFELMGKDTVVYCEGESAMLSVNPSNFSMDIEWYNEQGDNIGSGIMIEYAATGDENILIVAVDTFGCVDSLEMFLHMFAFDLSKDNPGTLCFGDTVELSVYNNTTELLSYLWEDKPNIISALDGPTITVVLEEDDDFVVNVSSDEYGCETQEIISVFVSMVDIYEIYPEPDTNTIVITKSLDLSVSGDWDPSSQILWSTGESTETITVSPTETGDFCVTITDQYGCFDEECFTVYVVDPFCDERDIFIPNAFSPNDDDDIPNNNDIFRPRSKYLEEVEMTIIDRWGEELFHAKFSVGDPGKVEDVFWDGRYNGVFLGPDSYAYILNIMCQDGEIYQDHGNISIIK